MPTLTFTPTESNTFSNTFTGSNTFTEFNTFSQSSTFSKFTFTQSKAFTASLPSGAILFSVWTYSYARTQMITCFSYISNSFTISFTGSWSTRVPTQLSTPCIHFTTAIIHSRMFSTLLFIRELPYRIHRPHRDRQDLAPHRHRQDLAPHRYRI